MDALARAAPAVTAAGGRDRPLRWFAALSPSLADVFFVAVIVWLFAARAGGWSGLLADGDTGWHLRTGEYVLAHHAVPARDLFSFSKPGAPWFAWEWGSDVIFAALWHACGLKGVVLLAAASIGAYALIVLRYAIWCGANAFAALLLTLVAVNASSVHFLARPHVFTLVLFPTALWILDAGLRTGSRSVFVLVPLTAIWANLHGGFALFLVVLGCAAVGTAFQSSWRWDAIRNPLLLFASCTAATFLNPYGWRLHQHIGAYLYADWLRDLVQEFQAPTFRGEGQIQFELLLFAALFAVVLLVRDHRRDWTAALRLVVLAHCALISLRHAPLFAAAAAPVVAAEVTRLWRALAQSSGAGSTAAVLCRIGDDAGAAFSRNTAWAGVAVALLAVAPFDWPRDFPPARFPIAVVDRYADILVRTRLFTTDQWADYLIYRLYPRQRVFLDGRTDFYGERLSREYVKLMRPSSDWKEELARHHFDAVLLPSDWPLVELLKTDSGWRLVYERNRALLFVKTDFDSVTRSPREENTNIFAFSAY